MLKKIKKSDSKKFADEVCAGLEQIGAKYIGDCLHLKKFSLETIVGNLTVSVAQDNEFCYTVFSRFDDIDRAKEKFNCNISGKYNFHIGSEHSVDRAIEFALMQFECCVNVV